MKHLTWPLSIACLLLIAVPAFTQERPKPKPKTAISNTCDPIRARGLIEQQLTETKTIDDTRSRIKLLVRIAELLWPAQQELARNPYAEAYELAALEYQRAGDTATTNDSGLLVRTEELRFWVIQSIARRDSAWAKQLYEKALNDPLAEANKKIPEWSQSQQTNAKLLRLADSLLPEQKELALEVARRSLRYNIDWNDLPAFLYNLAGVDQTLADAFYGEALNRYAAGEVEEFLALSAYPFGTERLFGWDHSSSFYRVPAGYAPNSAVQQTFLEALFQKAQQAAQNPQQSANAGRQLKFTGPVFILAALNMMEPYVARSQPQLLERMRETATMMASALDEKGQASVAGHQQSLKELETFEGKAFDLEKQLAEAEREKDPDQRDRKLAYIVLGGVQQYPWEKLQDVADKISALRTRAQLLNWLYLRATQRAVKEGRWADAAALARKVETLSQRAYLFFEIASAAYEKTQDETAAREALQEVATLADKADNDGEKARARLGIASIYTKFDRFRAIEAMREAVNAINRSSNKDFTRSYTSMLIQGQTWTMYTGFNSKAFNLEDSFTALATVDFESALSAARNLADKTFRATAIVALAVPCLTEKPPAKKTKAPAKP